MNNGRGRPHAYHTTTRRLQQPFQAACSMMSHHSPSLRYGTAGGILSGPGLLLPPPKQCTTHAHEHTKHRLVATTTNCTRSSQSAASYNVPSQFFLWAWQRWSCATAARGAMWALHTPLGRQHPVAPDDEEGDCEDAEQPNQAHHPCVWTSRRVVIWPVSELCRLISRVGVPPAALDGLCHVDVYCCSEQQRSIECSVV